MASIKLISIYISTEIQSQIAPRTIIIRVPCYLSLRVTAPPPEPGQFSPGGYFVMTRGITQFMGMVGRNFRRNENEDGCKPR
jgi:hypothetical protein